MGEAMYQGAFFSFENCLNSVVVGMKVSRGQKVRLVTAASHFVVSWFLILDFRCRYVVSRYRYVSSSLYLDCGLSSCHSISSVFHFVT